MIQIRPEQPADQDRVHEINELAFEQPAEANIVDTLRAACPDALSLVAADTADLVGHIFFSPAIITGDQGELHGMGLAPMAVDPARQRQGIGSLLVEHGLAILREQHCPFVIVLGHPEFYPRFGFEPASRYGITCQWDGVPDEAFMVLFPSGSPAGDCAGRARYRDEFDEAM
ncbi:MAG: N-acetyltransferase [bacterium]